MLTWSAWQIADKFLLSDTLVGILRMIFLVVTIGWLPIMIMVISIGLVKHFTDIDIEKTTSRGLFPRKK